MDLEIACKRGESPKKLFRRYGIFALLTENEFRVDDVQNCLAIFSENRVRAQVLFGRDVLAKLPARALIDAQHGGQVERCQGAGFTEELREFGLFPFVPEVPQLACGILDLLGHRSLLAWARSPVAPNQSEGTTGTVQVVGTDEYSFFPMVPDTFLEKREAGENTFRLNGKGTVKQYLIDYARFSGSRPS
jgi:hypothetical protein